jgi:transposase
LGPEWSEPLLVDSCAHGIDSSCRVPEDEDMARNHRSHSIAFKLQVVQAYLEGDGGMDAIAHRHQISPYLVQDWIAKYRRGELTETMERKERIKEYEVKIASLERKVGQLAMEVDFLKKYQEELRKKDAKPSILSGPGEAPSRKGAAS